MSELSHRFLRRQRLSSKRSFAEVYASGVRKPAGPFLIRARPNGLSFSRLGLTVPRKVGSAVRRHRVKRLLREAFRLNQDRWPVGYDIVVAVRPHDPATRADYERMLGGAIQAAHATLGRKKGG